MSKLLLREIDGKQDAVRQILPDDVLTRLFSLCERYHVETLDLFGSAATGKFDTSRSDIDFIVEFPPLAEPAGRANAFFGLHEALETLFGRRVDLLTEKSVKNPFLRRSIDGSRLRIFPRGDL